MTLRRAMHIKADSWKDFFFLLWRRWKESTALADSTQQNGPDLAMFPADTRLADHSIWEHMSLTAAFEACRNSEQEKITPSFLLFQLGPVQDFIAAARSTRDLWSGSYLLSYLMAHAMKAISDEIGPSSVIFPNLCGQGVFDLANKEIFDRICYTGAKGEESLWHRIYGTTGNAPDPARRNEAFNRLFAPTLPNRFLALVPSDRAEKLAQLAEEAIHSVWKEIGDNCFSRLCRNFPEIRNWEQRWDKQTEQFWQITYQTMPFFASADEAMEALKQYPDNSMRKTLENLYKIATEKIPQEDRDGRNYADKNCTRLSRAEFAWSLNIAEAFRALAARRNTREFAQFQTDDRQEGSLKDILTGKEETIGPESFWKTESPWFKQNEGPYGAITIIKRLWANNDTDSYLSARLDSSQQMKYRALRRFQSTEDLVDGNAVNRDYIAILAMDGDGMGKWMNGDNAPFLADLLEENAKKYFQDRIPDFQSVKRPLSPGYHAQFSEMLTNFTSRIAGKVVADFDGQLIYAGGDDVLAMLPMDKVLACAWALRDLFQGKVPERFKKQWCQGEVNGFLRELDPADGHLGAYLTVPGIRADVSCGIAIGHMHYPLQHLVNEAREAEHRAKDQYKRGAVAVSALKRSGEILHWGSKWDCGALELFDNFTELTFLDEKLSKRFAYAFAALCAPYCPGKIPLTDAAMREIIAAEFDHVCKQQVKQMDSDVKAFQEKAHIYFAQEAKVYSDQDADVSCENFINLFLLACFINRMGEEK